MNSTYPSQLFYNAHCQHHHPVKHLLLIGYLFKNWKDFISEYYRPNENDSSIAKLINVSKKPIRAKQALDRKVYDLLVNANSLRVASEITGCSVNYVKKIALLNDIHIDTRAQKLFVEERDLIVGFAEKGLTSLDISKQLKCSIGAVDQIISQTKGLVEKRKTIRFEHLKERHRESIRNSLKLCTHRGEIQKQERSSYTWLYKNDREWLYLNLPPAIPRHERYKM